MSTALKFSEPTFEPEQGVDVFGGVLDELFEVKDRMEAMMQSWIELKDATPTMQHVRDMHVEILGMQAQLARASRQMTHVVVWNATDPAQALLS